MADRNCKPLFPLHQSGSRLTYDGSSKMLFQILLSELFRPPVLHHNNQEISNGGRWSWALIARCRDCLAAELLSLNSCFFVCFVFGQSLCDCSVQLLKGARLEWVKQRTQYCKYASWQSSSKPRSGQGTQNRFLRLYETFLPENLGKHCREWPAGKTEIKLFVHENSKPQDLIVSVHWWLSHQRSVRVGLHCQASTIHEDSAAYTVSISSLTMEVEEVTHAFRWIASRGDKPHMPSSSQIQRDCYEKRNENPHSECVDGRHPPSKTVAGVRLPWTCRSEGKRRTEQIDWRAKQPPQQWLASRKICQCWKAWDTTCGHWQSQGHHTIDRLEERRWKRKR